jgi:septation ring formation regulator EzrA
MTKEKSSPKNAPKAKSKLTDLNPLGDVAPFDPGELPDGGQSVSAPSNKIASPLGTPQPVQRIDPEAANPLLTDARRRIEQLEETLTAERQARQEVERKMYQLEVSAARAETLAQQLERERETRMGLERTLSALEVEVRSVREFKEALESERVARLDLERRTATLQMQAERASEIANQLAEERQARVDLERERAALKADLAHAKKIETLLTEERQARANAQLRASTAEAKLSRLEGEIEAQSPKSGGSLFGRLRGR